MTEFPVRHVLTTAVVPHTLVHEQNSNNMQADMQISRLGTKFSGLLLLSEGFRYELEDKPYGHVMFMPYLLYHLTSTAYL